MLVDGPWGMSYASCALGGSGVRSGCWLPEMPNKRHPRIDDICGFRQVSDAQLSPDGKVIAFVVGDSYISGGKLPKANIWMVSAEGREAWALTSGPRSDAAPRWSPDGQTLGFLSDREKDGFYQLYLHPRNEGEAQRLGRVEGAIPTTRSLKCLEWSSDGQNLLFLMTDSESEEEKRRREEKDDAIEFEQNPKYTRLYRMNTRSEKTTCLSPEGLQIWEFAVAPSGGEFAGRLFFPAFRAVLVYLPSDQILRVSIRDRRPLWGTAPGLQPSLVPGWQADCVSVLELERPGSRWRRHFRRSSEWRHPP